MTAEVTLPPAAADALADPTIRRTPTLIVVYWYCLGTLDTETGKRLRIADVVKEVGKKERHVSEAMRWLVANGFLIRGPKLADRYTYKLAKRRLVPQSVPFRRVG